MEPNRRGRLNHLMATVAAGDDAALFALWCEFGSEIRMTMRSIARTRGHRYLPADTVDELAGEAWLALRDVAPAWRPDGALPWVWARPRLVGIVDRLLPRPTLPFPDEEPAAASGGVLFACDDPPTTATLSLIALERDDCALLREALDRALAPSHQDLLLTYAVQQRAADPSPANTLATMYGLKPATVRQRVARFRKRTLAVITADPRFASLTDLPLFRGGAPWRAA
jgi:hypothetical protein